MTSISHCFDMKYRTRCFINLNAVPVFDETGIHWTFYIVAPILHRGGLRNNKRLWRALSPAKEIQIRRADRQLTRQTNSQTPKTELHSDSYRDKLQTPFALFQYTSISSKVILPINLPSLADSVSKY